MRSGAATLPQESGFPDFRIPEQKIAASLPRPSRRCSSPGALLTNDTLMLALFTFAHLLDPHRFYIYITSYFTAILSCLRHIILISLQSVHSRVTTCVQRYESCLVTNSILFCWLVTIKHQCKKIFL